MRAVNRLSCAAGRLLPGKESHRMKSFPFPGRTKCPRDAALKRMGLWSPSGAALDLAVPYDPSR